MLRQLPKIQHILKEVIHAHPAMAIFTGLFAVNSFTARLDAAPLEGFL